MRLNQAQNRSVMRISRGGDRIQPDPRAVEAVGPQCLLLLHRYPREALAFGKADGLEGAPLRRCLGQPIPDRGFMPSDRLNPLGNGVTVAQQTLTLFVLVRIQVPQPSAPLIRSN